MQKYIKIKKTYCCTKDIKMENNECKKVPAKNFTCPYFNVDNISIHEKAYDNIFLYKILYKNLSS